MVIVCVPGRSPDWSKTKAVALPVAEIRLRPVCTVSLTAIFWAFTPCPPTCSTVLLTPLCNWLALLVSVISADLPARRVPLCGVYVSQEASKEGGSPIFQCRSAEPVLVILTAWDALLVISTSFVLSFRPGQTPSRQGLNTRSAPNVPLPTSKKASKSKMSKRPHFLRGAGGCTFPWSRKGTTSSPMVAI